MSPVEQRRKFAMEDKQLALQPELSERCHCSLLLSKCHLISNLLLVLQPELSEQYICSL